MKFGVRTILPVLAALAVWSCAGVSQAPPPLPAVSADQFGPEVRKAVEEAYSRAEAEPESGAASGRLGMVLHAHELLEPAAQAYERAVILDPGTFKWRYYLGLIQHDLAQLSESAETISSAVELRPDYAPARVNLGQILQEQGRFDESERVLNAVVEMDPESARALYFLGRVHESQEDLDGAAGFYQQAIAAYPGYGAAYFRLAAVQQRQGSTTESTANLANAERLGTGSFPREDPVLDAALALEVGPSNRLRKAGEAIYRREWAEASAALDSILEQDPRNLDALIAYLLMGSKGAVPLEQMRDYFNRARALTPDNPQIYVNYGTVLARNELYSEAIPVLQRAIELNPGSAEAHALMGYIREELDRPKLAIEQYKRALEAQDSYRPARLALGRLLVNEGRYKEAIPRLRRALEVEDSDTTMVMLSLAQAYLKTGNVGRGQEYLRHAQARVKRTGPPELLEGIEGELARTGAIP